MVNDANETLRQAYNDDGAAIYTEWATKLDTMGTLSQLKTMPKRGSSVHMKSYAKSAFDVYIRTENSAARFYKTMYADQFTFDDIDFKRISFVSSENAILPLLIKLKKWKAIQFVFVSDAVNEGLGIYELEVKWEDAGEAKK